MTAVARRLPRYPRAAGEWYVEPVGATLALLDVERFVGPVWDPACGQGNVLAACTARGVPAVGSDTVQRFAPTPAPLWAGPFDFLGGEPDAPLCPPPEAWGVPNVVTNPPFDRGRGTAAFIRRALALATGKVAVFADLGFLAGEQRRAGLWSETPPHRVWVLTPRPSCPPGVFLQGGGKAEGGSADWCWMVWDRTAPAARPGETRLGWAKVRPS